MSTDNEVRQRSSAARSAESAKGSAAGAASSSTSKKSSAAGGGGFSILDLLRALAGVALLSTLGSWLVTGGQSYAWGYDKRPLPWWASVDGWKRQMTPQLQLTMEELATFDGTDGRPIYLAINRTIYDMSASPAVYGPGGFYAKLAAKDASRSFVTTCFDPKEDLVPYLGGVEEIYVPLWLSKKPSKAEMAAADDSVGGVGMEALMDQVKSKLGKRKTRKLREQMYDEAKVKVAEKIKTWEAMFQKKGYPIVGRVVGVDDTDESKWKHLGFCEDAIKQRPPPADSLMLAVKMQTGKDKLDIANMGGGKAFSDTMRKAKKGGKGKAQQKGENTGKGAGAGAGHADDKANANVADMSGKGKYGAAKYPGAADGSAEKLPWEQQQQQQQ